MNTIAAQHVPQVRVDVRLCGSIPRDEMDKMVALRGAPCPLLQLTSSELDASYLAATNGSAGECSTHHKNDPDMSSFSSQSCFDTKTLQRQQQQAMEPRLTPIYEPPAWAVPARGESRLEPVCEAVDKQSSVDLTSRSFFRIGRSPQSDVQLMHATSSRRHALIFHHSNGACYIVDCGSAHGTFVNGNRIRSPPRGGSVIPHRVRRGSLIRFGGPGAPCFVLKSFAFELADFEDSFAAPSGPTLSPSQPELSKVLQLNTRLNALGKSAADAVLMNLTNKRRSLESCSSFDSFEVPPCKRMRCSSPPLSPEKPLRLVSPDLPNTSKQRRVHFSLEPPSAFYPALVTPETLSSDEDCNSI